MREKKDENKGRNAGGEEWRKTRRWKEGWEEVRRERKMGGEGGAKNREQRKKIVKLKMEGGDGEEGEELRK